MLLFTPTWMRIIILCKTMTIDIHYLPNKGQVTTPWTAITWLQFTINMALCHSRQKWNYLSCRRTFVHKLTNNIFPGSTPNGQVKSDAPRFPPPQPHQPPPQHHQPPPQRSSPDKVRPVMPPGPMSNVSALSAALAGRDRGSTDHSREHSREVPREPPMRPAVRRQPSDIRTRGPPPQPPTQKMMPLVSLCKITLMSTCFYLG